MATSLNLLCAVLMVPRGNLKYLLKRRTYINDLHRFHLLLSSKGLDQETCSGLHPTSSVVSLVVYGLSLMVWKYRQAYESGSCQFCLRVTKRQAYLQNFIYTMTSDKPRHLVEQMRRN